MADFGGFHDIGMTLMDRLGGQLPDGYVEDLELYLGSGEEGLFADLLAHVLVAHRVPIDRAARELLVTLLAYFPATGDAEHYPYIYDRDRTLAAITRADDTRQPGAHD